MLNRRVLLLNQSYEPLMVIGARRAIILLLSEKVESLENYHEIIHSVYLSLPLPSVIKLKEYARIRRKEIVLSRKNILKRDNHTCQYCGKKSVPMTIDHIISRNKGGGDSWDNLVAACVPCNTKKGNLSLKHIQMDLSKIPRKPTMILHLQKFVKQFQSSWRPYLFMQDKN
ncbi:MAG TPA: HNH endonuclease [Candidatus Marinimicrobia bacterium]|nr:HNH endonuclease [Candidatus Neomarinimicrobiota bacterium]